MTRDVQVLVDRADILDLMHRYTRAADTNDAAGMAAVFADPCAYDLVPSDPGKVCRSPAAIVAMVTPLIGKVVAGSHYISNAEYAFDGPDRAIMTCYMFSWQKFDAASGGGEAHRSGRYEALAVRGADGWRFASLRLIVAADTSGREAEHMGRPWPPVFGG